MPRIYLDHNATSPLLAPVRQAMAKALTKIGNPSSMHCFGRDARHVVDQARTQVASVVGVPAGASVIFTASATEANNMVITGAPVKHIIQSAVEHDSIAVFADRSKVINVDHNGLIDLAHLQQALDQVSGRALICVMLANNEIGVIQPLAKVVAIARKYDAFVHCDAVQAVGRIAVSMAQIGVDSMVLSAHKFGGPPGVGALCVSDRLELTPLVRGGGQEYGLRAGTENTIALAGFSAGLQALDDIDRDHLLSLRDRLEEELIAMGAVIFGHGVERLPNTSCFALPGVEAETLVIACDLAGFAISAGSACSSGKVSPSRVIAAMGDDAGLASLGVRVSLGPSNSDDEIGQFTQILRDIIGRIRGV